MLQKIRRFALDYALTDVLSNRYCCVNRVDLRQCGLFRQMTETNGCAGYKPLRYAGKPCKRTCVTAKDLADHNPVP